MICAQPASGPRGLSDLRSRRSAQLGIHVARIAAYVQLRPRMHTAPSSDSAAAPEPRLRPGPGLSSGVIHPRPAPFTGGHLDRVCAVRGRWRPSVNVGQHCWKACWGQPLRSSNLLSSATLTCKNFGSWQPVRGALHGPWAHLLSQFERWAVPSPGRATAIVPGHGRPEPTRTEWRTPPKRTPLSSVHAGTVRDLGAGCCCVRPDPASSQTASH
jgi:hypothetical protein